MFVCECKHWNDVFSQKKRKKQNISRVDTPRNSDDVMIGYWYQQSNYHIFLNSKLIYFPA